MVHRTFPLRTLSLLCPPEGQQLILHLCCGISLVLEPSPNSPSAREAASRAARTGPWPGPDTAAGAYAIASSDERGSSGYPLLLRNRRVRMTTVLDAPHRSVHLPPSL